MAKRLRKEEQIMPDIRILTEGDSSVLVEFGKEISPEINRKITATVQLMKEQHIEGVVEVVKVASEIKPSARGEYEITTVNQAFLKAGELKVALLGRGFAWLDTGTHDSLSEASTYVEVVEKRQGLKIACLEGIAYRKGWISEERMRELAQPMLKSQYGQHLLKVIDEKKHEVDSDTFRK